jgi:hypothetical protein
MTNKRLTDIMSRMTDLGTEKVNKSLMCMLYGKPGTGKTVLATGLAQYIAGDKKVLYIDTREGWVSLENHAGMVDNVIRVQYQQFSDLALIAEAIRAKDKGFENIGAVVIDEFSTAADMLLDDLFREDIGAQKDEIPTEAVDARLYKPLGDACRKAVEMFQTVPGLHVILVAHERETVDHRKVKVTKPGFSPKNNDGIQKLMHVTAHVTNEIKGSGKNTTYERLVQSHPSALVDAKSRIGGLPLQCDTGTFVQIVHDWLNDETVGLEEYESREIAEDALPDEGIPVAEDYTEDDEPVFVGETE